MLPVRFVGQKALEEVEGLRAEDLEGVPVDQLAQDKQQVIHEGLVILETLVIK